MSFNSRKLLFGSPNFSDPYWDNVSLLLHGDGIGATPNGQQNNTFLDNSLNNFTITRLGTPTQGSFSPYPVAVGSTYDPLVNGGSLYFDGSSYLNCGNLTNYDIASVACTMELWVKFSSKNVDQGILGKGYVNGVNFAQYDIGCSSGNKIFSNWGNGTSPVTQLVSVTTINTDTWYHVAITKTSTQIVKLYINGILEAQTTLPWTPNIGNTPLYIGRTSDASNIPNFLNGYISDARIIKGSILYTTNFTPPTAPLTAITNTQLLLRGTNAGIFDNAAKNNLITVGNAQVSTSVKKYGSGSMLFNGSTDYCRTIAPAGTHQFGTGDFTIECWAYCTNLNSGQSGVMGIIDFRASTTNEARPTLLISNSSFCYFSNQTYRIQSGTISANTWYHVAVVRSSGSTKLYVNGTNVGVTYADANNYLDGTPTIGNYLPNPIYGFAGYIDDVRITKGVARYTSNFTPPIRSFPNK